MSNQADYKKLRKIWYKKLKESGFNDIETGFGPYEIKGGSYKKYSDHYGTGVYQETRQEYYYMAYQFLNNYTFDDKLHESIWAYHVEGIGIRSIAKILKDAGIGKKYKLSGKVKAMSPQKIWQIVKFYRDIMKKSK